MKKKLLAALLIGAVGITSLTGCKASPDASPEGEQQTEQGSGEETEQETDEVQNTGDAIRIVNGKIEIDRQLKAFAESYKERTGQEVVIESLGGGVDIGGAIKGYLAAGNMPDIFVFGGEGEYEVWKEHMEDLSDEAWVAETEFAFVGGDGQVVGFPYALEGYGITYNADILEAAGVDPADLTNATAYKEAFEKIDSMKDELGIDAVASVAAEAGEMFWSTGNHIFGYYLSLGLDRNDDTYIDLLRGGEVDEERLGIFADFIKMLFEYSDPSVLVSGTYDDQLALWAQGKTAFVTQGNWIDPSLPDYGVEFATGIAPLAFLEEDTKGVLVDSPSWWAVYNESQNIQAAKDFLNDLVFSDEGQEALIKEAGMISPFTVSDVEPSTPLAANIKTYVDSGDTYAWDWVKMPEGIAQNSLGVVFELYAKDELTKDEFIEMMGNALAEYVKN